MRLIDADAAFKTLSEEAAYRIRYSDGSRFDVGRSNGIILARDIIKDAPTVDAAPVDWISVEDRLPESGKHVLLCCEVRPSKKKYVCDGFYAATKSITCGSDTECDTEYDDETDEYYLPYGFYEVIKNWDDFSSVVIDDFITHWMPLPNPPGAKMDNIEEDGEE